MECPFSATFVSLLQHPQQHRPQPGYHRGRREPSCRGRAKGQAVPEAPDAHLCGAGALQAGPRPGQSVGRNRGVGRKITTLLLPLLQVSMSLGSDVGTELAEDKHKRGIWGAFKQLRYNVFR